MLLTCVAILALSAVASASVQTLNNNGEVILPGTTYVNIDALGWKGEVTTEKYRIYALPSKVGQDGAKITIHQHHSAITYLTHPDPYGALTPLGVSGGAEFSWIRLSDHDDSVDLTWVDYNHGWTIDNKQQMAASISVNSWRPHEPPQGYVLLTARSMYEDESDFANNGKGKKMGKDVPDGLTEMVGTIDTDPRSTQFGQVVDLAPGKYRASNEFSGEHHHGGIVTIDGKQYMAAPSLSWKNSYIDFYSLASRRGPELTDVVKRVELQDVPAGALHTIHLNHDSGRILVTALGDGTEAGGVGRVIELTPKLGAGLDFDIESRLFHNFADDDLVNGCNGGPCLGREDYTQNDGLAQYPIPSDGNGGFVPLGGGGSFAAAASDKYTYDFGINEATNTMVSTSWAPTSSFDSGFNPFAIYGNHIKVHRLRDNGKTTADQGTDQQDNMRLLYAVETKSAFLGGAGIVPLEVRRKHCPVCEDYFVGVTLPGAIMRVYNDDVGNDAAWNHTVAVSPFQVMADAAGKVSYSPDGSNCGALTGFGVDAGLLTNVGTGPINIPCLGSSGFGLVDVPIPLITDITISNDDTLMAVACWLSGTVLLYDISDSTNVVLVGGIANLGGVTTVDPSGANNWYNPNSYVIDADYKGSGTQLKFAGGPQMMRFDAGGGALYVSNSLFSNWDDQIYNTGGATPSPDDGSIKSNGGMQIRIKTGYSNGVKVAPASIDTRYGNNGVIVFDDLEHKTVDGPFKMRAHEFHFAGVEAR